MGFFLLVSSVRCDQPLIGPLSDELMNWMSGLDTVRFPLYLP